MNSKENIEMRIAEQTGEVLGEDEGLHGQNNDSTFQNKWEVAMKNVPSFDEHMEQMENEEEISM